MKYKYLIIGTSRSGKSTVAKNLLKQNGGTFLNIVDYVYDYIKREGIAQSETDFNLLKVPYEDLCRDLNMGKDWDILEVASDFPGIYVPKIVSTTTSPVKLIFCQCPVEICLKRNRQEERIVPEEIIKNQNKYDENFYRKLTTDLGIEFEILDTAYNKL